MRPAALLVLTSALVVAVPTAVRADDDLAQVLAETTVTPAMLSDAVIRLRPEAIDLDPATSTLGVVRQSTGGSQTLTSDLLFAFDSAQLSSPATAEIQRLAADIPQGAAVAVDGHTDALGGDAINLPLSQQRAEAVAAVLRQARPDLVLTVTGHGSTQPVASETTPDGDDDPAGRALNRRVVVTYGSS